MLRRAFLSPFAVFCLSEIPLTWGIVGQQTQPFSIAEWARYLKRRGPRESETSSLTKEE